MGRDDSGQIAKNAIFDQYFMPKVLIIEDSLEIRENTAEILTLEGYDVLEADNGVDGLQAAKTGRPDLILCDIMMPGMDGHTVCKTLRSDPSFSSVPFVFLTARSETRDIEAGFEAGATSYLVKPFNMDELLEKVSSLMNG
jgi:DNA-binding response OmpR family regulator